MAVQGSPHIHPVSHSPLTVDARGIFSKHRPGPLPFTLLKTQMASTRLWINPKVLTVAQETPARWSWLIWVPSHTILPSIPTCAPFPSAPTLSLPPAACAPHRPLPLVQHTPTHPSDLTHTCPFLRDPPPDHPCPGQVLAGSNQGVGKAVSLLEAPGENPSPVVKTEVPLFAVN